MNAYSVDAEDGRFERHLLPSDANKAADAGSPSTLRVELFLPAGVPPPGGWPSLLLLDAQGCFQTAVEALRRMARRPDATGVSPLVLIGLSHGTPSGAENRDTRARRLDYTTPAPDPAERPGSGGAAAFLDRIEREVKPLAASRAPLDPDRQTLFGHSLGGYFTLWTLLTHPRAFRAYAAISPSIWWDRDLLTAALAGADLGGRRALLLTGEWEAALPPWQAAGPGAENVRARRAARDMVGSAEAFGALLAGRMDAGEPAHATLAGEDHASILSAAVPRALRLASRP